MEKKYLSPKNDLVFKLIFGDRRNSDVLIEFLKNMLDLPDQEYDHIEFADTHLLPDDIDGKMGILDIKLYTKNKNVIDIEIQVWRVPDLQERILFYLSRMVFEQIKQGDDYRKIKKAISIVITDFSLIEDSDHYCNRYRLYDKNTQSEFTELVEVITLELPKLPAQNDQSGLWEWLQFIKSEKEEVWTMLAEKNPQIKKAVAVVKKLSEEERIKRLAESREKAQWDEYLRMTGSRAEGKVEGILETQIEIVRAMRLKGFDEFVISEITKLSIEEIRKLG